jgi:histidine triad (HIT) family protein
VTTSCKFCAIEQGTATAHVVFETDVTLAFLDHRPVFPGHTLLIPRRHIETLPELPDDLMAPIFAGARRIAAAMEGGFGAHGTFVALNNRISQSVPHLHVHLVPRHRKDGLRGFFWPRTRYADDNEASDVAARVRAAIQAAG